ncbi:hypothetical protein BU24DRAFT_404387 [Aaosphaeria arxii CBS 175.79]|uniref:Uncharacterized protein n=1 Tax=Aaosphaeria arxii CBS 175.79 TaxID=1450172 RepID=A0A6A5Y806_9PLEO|nr:uncharacterized protein BU24DRAFT_404387 [Aaosphaeria arxii CBS 175.79]KAF2021373.1 hypothetical protein BU24DRAFT_404387 [Aaosphaeria arxii CBS 175.79]
MGTIESFLLDIKPLDLSLDAQQDISKTLRDQETFKPPTRHISRLSRHIPKTLKGVTKGTLKTLPNYSYPSPIPQILFSHTPKSLSTPHTNTPPTLPSTNLESSSLTPKTLSQNSDLSMVEGSVDPWFFEPLVHDQEVGMMNGGAAEAADVVSWGSWVENAAWFENTAWVEEAEGTEGSEGSEGSEGTEGAFNPLFNVEDQQSVLNNLDHDLVHDPVTLGWQPEAGQDLLMGDLPLAEQEMGAGGMLLPDLGLELTYPLVGEGQPMAAPQFPMEELPGTGLEYALEPMAQPMPVQAGVPHWPVASHAPAVPRPLVRKPIHLIQNENLVNELTDWALICLGYPGDKSQPWGAIKAAMVGLSNLPSTQDEAKQGAPRWAKTRTKEWQQDIHKNEVGVFADNVRAVCFELLGVIPEANSEHKPRRGRPSSNRRTLAEVVVKEWLNGYEQLKNSKEFKEKRRMENGKRRGGK